MYVIIIPTGHSDDLEPMTRLSFETAYVKYKKKPKIIIRLYLYIDK